jgi:hypothetical protein
MMFFAAIFAMIRNKKRVVLQRAGYFAVTIIFLLYPGIVTRVFTTLKCKTIGDKQYLMADYSVVCWEGEHTIYSSTMILFTLLYVLGIPLGSTLLLYCNRHKFIAHKIDRTNEKSIKKSEFFIAVFGSLFEAYEEKYYWFETVIMIQKCLLTGGLVLVAPGSSTQILVGLVIALIFYTIVLTTQPYAENEEDMMESIATASTVGTLLIGFALKASESEGGERYSLDIFLMDIILVGMFGFVLLSGLWMMLKALPCCASGGDDSDDTSVVGSSEIVKVFDPSHKFLSRTKTFALVKKAVDHDKVLKIQDIHRASKKQIREQNQRATKSSGCSSSKKIEQQT